MRLLVIEDDDTLRESLAEPRFPLEHDPHYAEIALRGMSVMVPALAAYHEHLADRAAVSRRLNHQAWPAPCWSAASA